MRTPLDSKKNIALFAPPLLLASTYLAFNFFVGIFGFKAGYLAGFLFYWLIWCLAFPLWVIGPGNLRLLFRETKPRFGNRRWLGLLLLFSPVVLAYATKFPEVFPLATPTIVFASIIISLVNATAEEILWRGVYLILFPRPMSIGYFYQAFWFGMWHLAPQSISANTLPGGTASLVVFAMVLGFAWGSAAWQTRSIKWTVIAHILLNSAGLGALVYLS